MVASLGTNAADFAGGRTKWRGPGINPGPQEAALILPGASSQTLGANPPTSARSLQALPCSQPAGRGCSQRRGEAEPVSSATCRQTSLSRSWSLQAGRTSASHCSALGQGELGSPELWGPQADPQNSVAMLHKSQSISTRPAKTLYRHPLHPVPFKSQTPLQILLFYVLGTPCVYSHGLPTPQLLWLGWGLQATCPPRYNAGLSPAPATVTSLGS